MSTGPQTDLKILATGLGAGILIDAVVVRCLLVPALVALFGRANWWLPSRLARVLRIPAGPARAAARRQSWPVRTPRSWRCPGCGSGPWTAGPGGVPPGPARFVAHWHNPHLVAEPIMGGAS